MDDFSRSLRRNDVSNDALPRRAMAALQVELSSLSKGSDPWDLADSSCSFMEITINRPRTSSSCDVCIWTSLDRWKRSSSRQITGFTCGDTISAQFAGRFARCLRLFRCSFSMRLVAQVTENAARVSRIGASSVWCWRNLSLCHLRKLSLYRWRKLSLCHGRKLSLYHNL